MIHTLQHYNITTLHHHPLSLFFCTTYLLPYFLTYCFFFPFPFSFFQITKPQYPISSSFIHSPSPFLVTTNSLSLSLSLSQTHKSVFPFTTLHFHSNGGNPSYHFSLLISFSSPFSSAIQCFLLHCYFRFSFSALFLLSSLFAFLGFTTFSFISFSFLSFFFLFFSFFFAFASSDILRGFYVFLSGMFLGLLCFPLSWVLLEIPLLI